MTSPQEKQSVNYGYLAFPIILGLLGGIIGYFILKRKENQRYAKYVLLIGFTVSVMWTAGIINLGMSTDPKPDPEQYYLKESNEIKDNNSIEQIDKQFPNIDNEIQDSKKQIGFYKESQLDVWSSLSMFHEDLTKQEILENKISGLKKITPENIDELNYLKGDLKMATSEFENTSIKSQIEYYESFIDYDQQKIIDLESNGISALEEYKRKENQEQINKYLERIDRLENLNDNNLDYLNTDKKVIEYVSNYRGTDNKGNTLQTEIESFIKEKYGYDALSESNPFLKDNWIKTNTIFYFGTDAVDDFSIIQERYKVVRYAFFYPLQGEYKTVFGFGFDTETYRIVADNQDSIEILNKLNNS